MPDAQVRHFMTTEVETVGPDAALAEVAQRMRSAKLSCVVVVDERRPVGVITERDLTGLCARMLAGEDPGDLRSVMSDGVVTLPADADCGDAVDTIQDGDAALQALARTMEQAIRAADTVYRYGGEEFLVLFPEVTADGAAIASEHIRKAVEEMEWPHEYSPFGHVTVSIGVSGDPVRDPNPTRTISIADEALYKAKQLGRNRVELEMRSGQEADANAKVA